MKRYLLFCTVLFVHYLAYAQCLIPAGERDSLFPVTNRYSTANESSIANNKGASVFNIASGKGIYYLFGNFTSLVVNRGSALVLDSATHAIQSSQKWKVNGLVTLSVPDGTGGFYICGNFSKIGDSSRRFLAQVNSEGRPTSWNPSADNMVKALYKRNDTLFIGGSFTQVFAQSRNCFAMYSLSGDTLLGFRGSYPSLTLMRSINAFVIQNDTIIYGGVGVNSIYKYNFKDNVLLPWRLKFTEYGEIKFLQFSHDSGTLVYACDYNGEYIRGISTTGGYEQYKIDVSMYWPTNSNSGTVLGLKVMGNKAYVAGYFEHVLPKSGIFFRRGFFSFDASSGNMLNEDLQLNGYPTFLDALNDKLFISGKFTSVNSVSRENFAVINSGSLSVGEWQLSPSDAVSALAFSKGKVFVAGHFNGINAVHRNGFAAVDSATNTILPWTQNNTLFTEGKRMLVKGDTLFLLGITDRPSSCMVDDFNTAFRMYSISSGLRLNASNMGYSRMDDFIIDSNYLYASVDREVRRYSLPGLIKDLSWGVSFVGAGSDHSPVYLMASGGKLYSVGDNRFLEPCTNQVARRGWFIVYDKSTGIPINYYSYEGASNLYNQITFNHALLTGDRLYIQGYFNNLNGKPRRNFVCVNVNTGSINNWEPVFLNSGINTAYFNSASDLKLHNGKIWFGSTAAGVGNNNVKFFGIGAIDTVTGDLMPALINYASMPGAIEGSYLKRNSANDFIFTNHDLIIAGDFDLENGAPFANLMRAKLTTGTVPAVTGTGITGDASLYVGVDSNKYYISGGEQNTNLYKWSYSGSGIEIKNNGSDTVWLKAGSNATSGQLKVYASSLCGNAPAVSKEITIIIPVPPPVPLVQGISNKCSDAPTASARLSNTPAGTRIMITLDGNPLIYNAADSTFQYFTSRATAAGSHTVVVKYENASGISQRDSSFTVVTTVTTGVSIITPVTAICSGTSVTFTATFLYNIATAAYQWQLNGINTGGNSSTFTTNTLANNDQVKFILTNNAACTTNSTAVSNVITMTVSAIIKPTGTASGPGSVCASDPFTITFTAIKTPVGAGVQLWESINEGTFLARNTQLYNSTLLQFAVADNNKDGKHKYFFTVTPPSGPCSITANTDTITVAVEQLSSPAITSATRVLTLTNPDVAAVYKWQVKQAGNNWVDVSPVVTGITFIANASGIYRITANKGQCTVYSNELSITQTDLLPSAGTGVVLTPNPTSGLLTVNFLKLTDNWQTLEILSTDGKQKLATFNIENQTTITVLLDNLKNGLYLAVFKRKQGLWYSVKFIKK